MSASSEVGQDVPVPARATSVGVPKVTDGCQAFVTRRKCRIFSLLPQDAEIPPTASGVNSSTPPTHIHGVSPLAQAGVDPIV